jgi:hypothetical protein
MDQHALYRTLKDARCAVLVFEDHPQFFGNWRAIFKRGVETFEIVGDNREGWLTLWKQSPTGASEKVREMQMPNAEELGLLETLSSWLAGSNAEIGASGSEA